MTFCDDLPRQMSCECAGVQMTEVVTTESDTVDRMVALHMEGMGNNVEETERDVAFPRKYLEMGEQLDQQMLGYQRFDHLMRVEGRMVEVVV